MAYDSLPIALINQYVWELAKGDVTGTALDKDIWDTSLYTYVPFFPVHENLGDTTVNPYILYDYVFAGQPGTQWFVKREQALYTIIGSVPQIYWIKNFIHDSLNKFDASAQAINSHIQDKSIDFKWVRCDQKEFIYNDTRSESYRPLYVTNLSLTYEFTQS